MCRTEHATKYCIDSNPRMPPNPIATKDVATASASHQPMSMIYGKVEEWHPLTRMTPSFQPGFKPLNMQLTSQCLKELMIATSMNANPLNMQWWLLYRP